MNNNQETSTEKEQLTSSTTEVQTEAPSSSPATPSNGLEPESSLGTLRFSLYETTTNGVRTRGRANIPFGLWYFLTHQNSQTPFNRRRSPGRSGTKTGWILFISRTFAFRTSSRCANGRRNVHSSCNHSFPLHLLHRSGIYRQLHEEIHSHYPWSNRHPT